MRSNVRAAYAVAAIFALGVACSHPAAPPVATVPQASVPRPESRATVLAPSIAQFSAEPPAIFRGESSVLRWEVTGNVSSVSLDHSMGPVQNIGRSRVSPEGSVTYTLTATGPGGTSMASITVRVNAPPPPVSGSIAAGEPGGTLEARLSAEVRDAYFDYDNSDIREDAREALASDANALKRILADFPEVSIVIEGYSDERGSAEYNLGLSDLRAASAKKFVLQFGVQPDRLKVISYGKEQQQCAEANEACWQKNRRVHFVPGMN